MKSHEHQEEEIVDNDSKIDSIANNEMMVSRLSDASNVESGLSLNRQEQISDKMVVKPAIGLKHKNSEEEELKRASELLEEKMKNKTRKPFRMPLPLSRKIVPILPNSEP